MEGRMTMGLPISLEIVRVRQEIENVSLGMKFHNISPPPLTHNFRFGFEFKVMDRKNTALPDNLSP